MAEFALPPGAQALSQLSSPLGQGAARWRPGLAQQPLHSEVFARGDEASGAGLAVALACDALQVQAQARKGDPLAETRDRRSILWVQDRPSIERSGRPYYAGLPPEFQDRLVHVEATTAQDALFAMEEGLRCCELACVIGELWGNPRAMDFTASRRLSLTAEKYGVPLWLVRLEAQVDLSSARMRWRVKAAPSAPPRWNEEAPGAPAWQAELFRARGHAVGQWILDNADGKLRIRRERHAERAEIANGAGRTAHFGHLVRPTVGRSLAAIARA